MNIPFLRQLQRLTGPPTHEVVLDTTGPGSRHLEAALRYLLAELPDLLMAAVVHVATGKTLGLYTTDRGLRPDLVAGFNAEAVRQVRASMAAQGTDEEVVQEMLVTLHRQVHMVRLSPSGDVFVYLAADSRDTNLGIAREVMRGGIELLEPLAAAHP